VLGLLGGLLAGHHGPALVHAKRNVSAEGNAPCARLCRERFGPGRARGECIRAGAHGEGPCAVCDAEPERLCVDAAGEEICCPPEQVCGLVDRPAVQGCCRPAGAELPGGCTSETIEECCFYPCTPGSTTCIIRECKPEGGRCCLGGLMPCSANVECCSGLVCQGGACVDAPGGRRRAGDTITRVQRR
jgi:hypothetical protein